MRLKAAEIRFLTVTSTAILVLRLLKMTKLSTSKEKFLVSLLKCPR